MGKTASPPRPAFPAGLRPPLRAAVLCLALLAACAGPPETGGTLVESGEAPAAAAPERRIESPRFALLPGVLRPGDAFAAVLALPEDVEGLYAVLVSTRGRPLGRAPFFSLEQDKGGAVLKAALLAVPSLAAAGPGRVLIEGLPEAWAAAANGAVLSSAAGETANLGEGLPLIIQEREFRAETIALDRRNTTIRAEPDPRKNLEASALLAVINHTGSEIHTEAAFVPPVASTRRTSFYGDRRVYRYDTGAEDTAVHAGIDYGVPKGTPVSVCAPGRVVLARERIVTGNSVAIEHLPGVYSLYYHLDSIALAEGDMVAAGEMLGSSGATGLATGPHLHWEIRVAGENADPDVLAARPLLDREAIHALLSWQVIL